MPNASVRTGLGQPGAVALLDAAAIIRTLNHRNVDYVVIGGLSAMVHDLPLAATLDIDITPDRRHPNLDRLASALEDLDAGLLSVDQGSTWFPRRPVENWAQYDTLHLMTRYGPLDIVFSPDGAEGGYEDLVDGAEQLPFGDEAALFISVPTWLQLKEASGRQKDLEHLDQVGDIEI